MTRRSSYSFDIDLMRIAGAAVIVALVVGIALRLTGSSIGTAVVIAVLAGIASSLFLGPVRRSRPARSNSSG